MRVRACKLNTAGASVQAKHRLEPLHQRFQVQEQTGGLYRYRLTTLLNAKRVTTADGAASVCTCTRADCMARVATKIALPLLLCQIPRLSGILTHSEDPPRLERIARYEPAAYTETHQQLQRQQRPCLRPCPSHSPSLASCPFLPHCFFLQRTFKKKENNTAY